MHRTRLIAILAFAVAPLVPMGAHADAVTTDHTVTVDAGATKTWNGKPAVGANLNYHGAVPAAPGKYKCSQTDATQKCETVLLTLNNPMTQAERDKNLKTKSRAVTITLTEFSPQAPVTDFDLIVWETDASGNKLNPSTPTKTSGCACAPVLNSGYDSVVFDEKVTMDLTTTPTVGTFYYLLEIPYFTSVNSTYKGTVTF